MYITRLTQWSCSDECKYGCMWTAVKSFIRAGKHVPKFHGKVISYFVILLTISITNIQPPYKFKKPSIV